MDEIKLNKAAEEYSNIDYNYAEFPVTHYEFGDPVEEIEDAPILWKYVLSRPVFS